MFHVVLLEPEIPPNTGNIIRLCANTGAKLHLIHPLGFELNDRRLRRAGLDYHECARVREYADVTSFQRQVAGRTFAYTTRGTRGFHQVSYRPDDILLFGPETRGLPAELLNAVPPERRLRIPMRSGARSLNLSNAVAIVVYEAWRQLHFADPDVPRKDC